MIVEQDFFIGVQDVGAGNQVTDKALIEAMSNLATVHANRIGQGIGDRPGTHVAWVILNWKLWVGKRPGSCETVTVRTWAREWNRLQAYRDFEVLNAEKEVIAKATSVWLAVDPYSGSIVRLTPELMDAYLPEMDRRSFPEDFPGRQVDTPAIPLNRITFQITRSMIDVNRHVHNPDYLDIVQEVLPEASEALFLPNCEIWYKKEIRPGEEVLAEYSLIEGKRMIRITDADGALHARILLY